MENLNDMLQELEKLTKKVVENKDQIKLKYQIKLKEKVCYIDKYISRLIFEKNYIKLSVSHVNSLLEILEKCSKDTIPHDYYEDSSIYLLFQLLCRMLDLLFEEASFSSKEHNPYDENVMKNFLIIIDKFVSKVEMDKCSNLRNWRLDYYVRYCREMIIIMGDMEKLKYAAKIGYAFYEKNFEKVYDNLAKIYDETDLFRNIVVAWRIRHEALSVKDEASLADFQIFLGKVLKYELEKQLQHVHFPVIYAAQEALFDIMKGARPDMQKMIVGGPMPEDLEALGDKEKESPTLHYFSGESVGGQDSGVSKLYYNNPELAYRFMHGLAELYHERGKICASAVRQNFSHILDYMRENRKLPATIWSWCGEYLKASCATTVGDHENRIEPAKKTEETCPQKIANPYGFLSSPPVVKENNKSFSLSKL